MRKSLLVLALALLLAGCSAAPAGETLTPPTLAPGDSPAPEPVDAVLVDQAPWFATFRVVAGAETGNLVLAANGGSAGEVYTLSTEGLSLDRPVENGELINVYYEIVLETYPAQFGGVTAVEHTRTERDDRCGLYLQVLEDLWDLAWVFGNTHGLMPITGTLEEIWQAGYLTPMTEPAEGQEDSVSLYRWENGCLFVLTGSAEDGFDAEKWTSGIGAYMFVDCTVRQNADGTWSYTVGAEAIS